MFANLTVVENLALAAPQSWWDAGRAARLARRSARCADELLADFNLTAHADTTASELSFGQRKLLEFAATLMSRPRLVLLDEPAAGREPACSSRRSSGTSAG